MSVLATSICAALMGLGWEIGALIATFAMTGDLFSSFVKRRLHLASSSMAIGLDHIPEFLFPLLASRLLLPLSILDIVAGVTIFVVGALILSPLLFKLNFATSPTDGDRQLDRWRWCRVISGGQLKRTGTTEDPAPTDV